MQKKDFYTLNLQPNYYFKGGDTVQISESTE
jgi:hypothetical protein